MRSRTRRAAPPLFICAGTLYAAASIQRPRNGPIALLLLAILIVGWRMYAALRYQRPISRPTGAAIVYGVVIAVAWWMMNGGLPPVLPTAAVVAALAGAAILATRPRAAAALLILAPVGALWPDAATPVTWSAATPTAADDAPDLVLLCVDTLRADTARELAAYRRLAAEGVEFARAQAAGPWTLPSMATVMTGLPPWSHAAGSGPNWHYRGLPFDVPVLAEILREHGCDTAAVVHNPVVSEAFGFRRGFDVWDSATARTRWSLPRTIRTLEARPFAAHVATAAGAWGRRSFFDAELVARGALSVLASRREDRPLLLWAHFLDCHFPYRRASELGNMSRGRRMDLERGDADRFRADSWWTGEEGRAALAAAYAAELEAVDRALVEILAALGPPPARGRVVVLFSDHGEEFFEHGDVEHGHALCQELLAVPLVIAGLPGRAPGSVESALVGHEDLVPTLLAAAGIAAADAAAPHDRLPGRDLARAPLEPRPVASENLLRSELPWDSEWAWRDGDRKVIFGPDGGFRCYDLAEDPGERRDLADLWTGWVKDLTPRPARVPRRSAGGEETRRGMVNAGYVGN